MGTSWEADSLKCDTFYRSDAVGLSVSQERIYLPRFQKVLLPAVFIFCLHFFFLPPLHVMSALVSMFSENVLVLSVGQNHCLLQVNSCPKNLGRVRA